VNNRRNIFRRFLLGGLAALLGGQKVLSAPTRLNVQLVPPPQELCPLGDLQVPYLVTTFGAVTFNLTTGQSGTTVYDGRICSKCGVMYGVNFRQLWG